MSGSGSAATGLKTDVVGLPGANLTTGQVDAKQATITDTTQRVEVSRVEGEIVGGQGIAMTEEVVTVPRTRMVKETIEVQDIEMQTQTVERPVTVTRAVPEIVRDVEMRTETVTREEVKMDHKTIQIPATTMREVAIEMPRVAEATVVLEMPTEIMRDVKVLRPELTTERVKVMRPVQRTRTYRSQRPEAVKKMVTLHRPVRKVDEVKIEEPKVREDTFTVQVPEEGEKSVEYKQPVTIIRPTNDEKVAPNDAPTAESEGQLDGKRDWSKVPVGVPFTEFQTNVKTVSTTTLRDETTTLRQTWMDTVPVEKVGYTMEPYQVEVTETVMREVDYEVVETVLEEQEVDVEVTVMKEVLEKWPVTKLREETITTRDVFLEESRTRVPELTSKTVTVDVPRKVQYTEEITRAVPVEREVMVERPFTEMQRVDVQVPVKVTREVVVERPVLVHEQITIQTPQTIDVDVPVQRVRDDTVEVLNQDVEYGTKTVAYRRAEEAIVATSLGTAVHVGADVKMVHADLVAKAATVDSLKGMDWNVNEYSSDSAVGVSAAATTVEKVVRTENVHVERVGVSTTKATMHGDVYPTGVIHHSTDVTGHKVGYETSNPNANNSGNTAANAADRSRLVDPNIFLTEEKH